MKKSPFNPNFSTRIIAEIDSKLIIQKYWNEFRTDVKEYFKTEKFQLLQCNKTKYRFFYPLDLEGQEKLYIDLSTNRKSYYRFPKWEHTTVINFLANYKIRSLLEIGCANGDFIHFIRRCYRIKVSGIELNSQAVDEGKRRGLDIHSERIEMHKEKNIKYEAICSFQVIEHVSDVKLFFSNSLDILESGGLFIFGVPNSNPYLYYFDRNHTLNMPPHHMGLWDKETVKNVAKLFNLKVIKIFIEPPSDYEVETIINQWVNNGGLINRIFGLVCKEVLQVSGKINKRKLVLSLLKLIFQGRNLVAILQKK